MELPFQIDLTGQSAVVTGGSGVIGGVFCRALAACGAQVAVLGRSSAKSEVCAESIRKEGGKAFAVAADVLSRDSLLAARESILQRAGGINILVNCAGGAVPGAAVPQDQLADAVPGETTFFTADIEKIHRELDLNIYGTMLPTQIFGECLTSRKNANIINIASMGADRPLTRLAGYSAAKAAVANFTQWAAVYFARSGVRVNAIAPGFFHTTQNHSLQYNPDGTPTVRSGKILRSTPMERYGDPEDLIGALLYLASPKGSAFVTGVILPVDGGFEAYSGV